MLRPRQLLSILLLFAASLAVTASLASAAHVASNLPLTNSPNHSHEKFSGNLFPAGNYSSYSFAFADLSNCTFAAGTNLSFADFTGANLTNVNFSNSTLDNATFAGADLSFATIPCMGGADFRGAILTGLTAGGAGCGGCGLYGPNRYDNCTVNPSVSLCMASVSFRGVVAGVVFSDLNTNGQLDFGEPGVPGATVNVNTGPPGNIPLVTDSRGAYYVPTANAGAGTVTVVLPVGWVLTSPALQNVNMAACRSAQHVNFAARAPVVPVVKSTFGRVKAFYR